MKVVGVGEDGRRFFGKFNFPFAREHAKDRECASSAQPRFGNLFKMLYAMRDIAFSVFVW